MSEPQPAFIPAVVGDFAAFEKMDGCWVFGRVVQCTKSPPRVRKLHGLHPNSWTTLYHECHHAFVFREIRKNGRKPPFPTWVEEGLAQYFELSDLVGEELRTGVIDKAALRRLRRARAEGKTIPLVRLLAITGYDQVDNGVAYPEYWALVHYLEQTGLVRGRGGWAQFAGQWGPDSVATFTRAIGRPLGAFERDWWQYVAMLGEEP